MRVARLACSASQKSLGRTFWMRKVPMAAALEVTGVAPLSRVASTKTVALASACVNAGVSTVMTVSSPLSTVFERRGSQ